VLGDVPSGLVRGRDSGVRVGLGLADVYRHRQALGGTAEPASRVALA